MKISIKRKKIEDMEYLRRIRSRVIGSLLPNSRIRMMRMMIMTSMIRKRRLLTINPVHEKMNKMVRRRIFEIRIIYP